GGGGAASERRRRGRGRGGTGVSELLGGGGRRGISGTGCGTSRRRRVRRFLRTPARSRPCGREWRRGCGRDLSVPEALARGGDRALLLAGRIQYPPAASREGRDHGGRAFLRGRALPAASDDATPLARHRPVHSASRYYRAVRLREFPGDGSGRTRASAYLPPLPAYGAAGVPPEGDP